MKRIISISFIICCFATLILNCAKDVQVMTGTINGLVSEYSNANTPIPGATITLNGKGLTKTTGSDGRYEFTDLEPGTYTIAVSADGYQSTTKQVTVYAGQKANCDFQLDLGQVNVDISPLNLTFGKDIERLSFTIKNNSSRNLAFSVITHNAAIEVTPSAGTINAKSEQAISVKVSNRSSIADDISDQLQVNIGNDSYVVSLTILGASTTATTGTLTGLISDYASANSPISGATVSIASTGQAKTTGDDGRYQFSDLKPGMYTISVSANGYEPTTKDVTIEVGKTTTCDFQLQKATENVEVSPPNLVYSSDIDQLSFTIKNGSPNPLTYSVSNIPDFVQVSSATGGIAAKGSQVVTVSILNRKQITSKKNSQLTVNVGNNAYVVNISVEPYKQEAVNVDIQPQSMTFDKNTEQLSFTISSNNNRALDYSITSSLDFLTVSPATGTIKERGQNAISVGVKNRQTIDVRRTGQLSIAIEGNTFLVNVVVEPYKEDVDVSISPSSLTFSKETSQMSLTITSNNNRNLSFAANSSLDILTLTPNSGTINAKGVVTINANVKNREELTEDKNGYITIGIEDKSYTIPVSIAKAKEGGTTPTGEVVVTNGLMAYYTFDDGTVDDSRGKYHGFNNGGTFISDTPNGSGKALNLKQKQYVDIASAPFNGRKTYSVSLWVKDFGTGPILSSFGKNNHRGGTMYMTAEGKLIYSAGNASYYSIEFSTDLSSYMSGQWVMLTVVTTEDVSTLYVNGRKASSGTVSSGDNTGAVSMCIGGNLIYSWSPYSTEWADPMKIDNIRFYSVALSDDDVYQIYQNKQ